MLQEEKKQPWSWQWGGVGNFTDQSFLAESGHERIIFSIFFNLFLLHGFRCTIFFYFFYDKDFFGN